MSTVRSAWPDHPAYRIDLVPCKGTATVKVGDIVVAESTRALRVIETDHVERLYLPEEDVAARLLRPNDQETICPFKGRASYWSFTTGEHRVEDLFWTYREPFPEVAGLAGFLGVYHEKAAVEVRSLWPDGASSTDRFPVWGDQDDLLHVLDARAAGFHEPIQIEVDQTRRGRTFSTLSTRSIQEGKLIAPALILLDAGAPDTIRATADMPSVPGPDEAQPYEMSVTGRDLRIVDGAYSRDPDQIGPPRIHAWMRFRDNPQELGLRQALIAQATTHWSIGAAMLPHRGMSEALAHVSLSTGPVAMTLSFHDDAPMDRWFLYSTEAVWSGRGLVQGEGHVWAGDGRLIASYSLQAMVREMLPSAGGRDASTAM